MIPMTTPSAITERSARRIHGLTDLAVRLGACLALIPAALSASGTRVGFKDAFATARGNAFVATADNPSAIYYNPAGLTQLESQNLRGGIYGLYFDPRYTSPSSGRTFDNEKQLHAIPQLFYSWTLETLPLATSWSRIMFKPAKIQQRPELCWSVTFPTGSSSV